MQQVRLAEAPGGLFSLKEVNWAPMAPRLKEPFQIKGKVDLFNLPFLAVVWVIASVTYPRRLTDILGPPIEHRMSVAWVGKFTIDFPEGFDREGNYKLDVRVYLGPTTTTSAGFISSTAITLPPFPPVTSLPTQPFTVAGSTPPTQLQYTIGQPIAKPHDVVANNEVTITSQVTSRSDQNQNIVVRCSIYEGGRLWIAGALLKTISSAVTLIAPGATLVFTFKYQAVTGPSGIAKRDVSIDIWIGSQKVAGHQFDGVFYVRAPTGLTLELHADPVVGGYVTRSPIKSYYNKYDIVTLTAFVYGLYKFSYWSDEDGKTWGDPSAWRYDQVMVENKIITAHFALTVTEPPPPVPPIPTGLTLELHADPVVGGWVTRSPDKDYYDKYDIVTLTAWNYGLYKFSYWSDEDGKTWGDPNAWQYDQVMVENKIITAHFE